MDILHVVCIFVSCIRSICVIVWFIDIDSSIDIEELVKIYLLLTKHEYFLIGLGFART